MEYRGTLTQDEDPMSPAEWDTLGTLVIWHRRYRFQEDGAKVFGTPQDFIEQAKEEGWIYLPVAMLDHSGVTIWVGKGPHWSDQAGWDSGQVGFIYTTPKRMEELGVKAEDAERQLEIEVEEWDKYLTGDVWSYVIYRGSECVDAVGGFYGYDYAEKEMKQAIAYLEEQDRKAEDFEQASFRW